MVQFLFYISWEQRKLCDIAVKVTEKNVNTNIIETFTNSAEFGIVSQRDYFDHDISNFDNLSGYYIVQNDDFVYNPRISVTAPVGPINRNKLSRKGVMSPLYTVFRVKNIDCTFLEWYFKSEYWHGFMRFNGDSGARSDRFSIKDEIMFQMPLPYPDRQEQGNIGKLLLKLDNLITLHQCEYFLCSYKYVYLHLQQSISKKTNSWEQRKLGEVTKINMGQSPAGVNYTANPNDAILVQGNADMVDGWVCPRVYTRQITKKAHVGDLIFSVRAPVGEVGKTQYDVVIGRGVAAISGNEYIFQTLKQMNAFGYWTKLSAGSTFESINSDTLKSAKLFVPKENEQRKIGEILLKIDNLITLHQCKHFILFNNFLSHLVSFGKCKKTNSWEQRKLKNYFDERTERSGDGELISVTISSGIKKFSELNRHDTTPDDMSHYKVVCKGDIAYNSMRMWQGASGYSPYNGILSPAYTVIVPKNGGSSRFFAYLLKLPYMISLFCVHSQGLTKDTWNLKFPAFSEIECSAPTDIAEQDAIARTMEQLDNLITLHQRKLKDFYGGFL